MKYNRFFFALFIFFLVFPVTYVLADTRFTFEDRMNEGSSLFFMVELEEDEKVRIELKAREDGYFHLYLFDERPTETHVHVDGTIDEDIKKNKVDHDSGKNPIIRYYAEDDRIYYLQIILTKNGPDFFKLYANKKLSRYYLPQIPGYQIEILMLTIIFSIGIIILIMKRTILNERKKN